MIYLKRIFAAILISVMTLGVINVSYADTESTSSLSPKKVVAMLYDDSGSMHLNENTNWFYADYAMQLFTGLLNKDDELLLTFMSNPGSIVRSNAKGGLLENFSADRQKTVDSIRAYKGSGDTPFAAIGSVGEKLSNVKDENASTQYWFVIIADGSFEKTPGDEESVASTAELDKMLSKYAGKTMPNGSKCHILFMAIKEKNSGKGKKFKRALPTENEFVQVKQCDGQGIVGVMSEIADTVTGRYRVDETEVAVNGKDIVVSSAVPLMNIQVLTQNSDAKITSASASEGDGLQTSAITVASPKGDDARKEGKALHGTLSTIQSKGDYISAGEYTLSLDKEVEAENLVVMYEVALETRLKITRKGKLIKDTSVLRENDKIDIKAELVTLGTREAIDVSKLPAGVLEGMSLNIDENGDNAVSKQLENGESNVLYKDYVVKKGETVITAQTDLKGFAPLITIEKFTAQKPVVYAIKSEDTKLSLRRGYIRGDKGSVDFLVTGDGEPLAKQDVEALIDKKSISITHGGEKTGVKFRYEVTDDGRVHVYPKASLLSNAFAFFNVPKGQYDVVVSLDESNSAEGHFTVKGYPLLGIIISLIIWALILLLLYLIFKTHFPNAKIMVNSYSFMKSGRSPLGIKIKTSAPEKPIRINSFTNFFRVFGPRKIKTRGLELVARPGSRVYLSQKWVNNNKGNYLVRSVMTDSKTARDTAAINAFKKLASKSKPNQDVLTEEPLCEGDVLYVLSGKNVISYEIHRGKRR